MIGWLAAVDFCINNYFLINYHLLVSVIYLKNKYCKIIKVVKRQLRINRQLETGNRQEQAVSGECVSYRLRFSDCQDPGSGYACLISGCIGFYPATDN